MGLRFLDCKSTTLESACQSKITTLESGSTTRRRQKYDPIGPTRIYLTMAMAATYHEMAAYPDGAAEGGAAETGMYPYSIFLGRKPVACSMDEDATAHTTLCNVILGLTNSPPSALWEIPLYSAKAVKELKSFTDMQILDVNHGHEGAGPRQRPSWAPSIYNLLKDERDQKKVQLRI